MPPPDRPTPSPRLAHVHALLVGFDYDGSVVRVRPDVELPRLRGAVEDVIAEWCLLRELGLPPGNAHIFTDVTEQDMRARLSTEGLLDDTLDVRQITSEPAFYDAVVELSNAAAPGDEQRRLILMWSGHGDARPKAPHRPPALFMPDASHITVRGLMALLSEKWGWGRRRAGDPPNLVAVLSACHTAAALGSPEDVRSAGAGLPPTFGDLGAAVLAASTPSALAHEVYVDGRWRCALSWAATAVLSRYQRRRDGSLALTYAELMFRVRSLLAAIDVPDEPRLFAPTDEHNRYLLRGYGDLELGESRARDGMPIEIYPTNDTVSNDQAKLYEIRDTSTAATLVGYLARVGALTVAKWDSDWSSLSGDTMAFTHGILPLGASFTVAQIPTVVDLTSAAPSGIDKSKLSGGTAFGTLGTWTSGPGQITLTTPYFGITGGDHDASVVFDSSTSYLMFYSATGQNIITSAGGKKLTFTYMPNATKSDTISAAYVAQDA